MSDDRPTAKLVVEVRPAIGEPGEVTVRVANTGPDFLTQEETERVLLHAVELVRMARQWPVAP